MRNVSRLLSGWRALTSLAVVLFGVGYLSASAHAEDKKTDDPSQSGVRVLFDGKTLKDWERVDFAGAGEVVVRDGAIVLQQGEPITGIVWKGAPLPKVNYEYTMLARKVDGTDFFATVTFPVKESHCSLVLGGWGGGLIGLSSLDGADASENETTDYFTFEKNRWYKIRVRVTEHEIQAWIDDKQIANVDYQEKKISVRIEMELSKPLGLSSFQTTGEVKDIQVRPLAVAARKQGAE